MTPMIICGWLKFYFQNENNKKEKKLGYIL